MQSDLILPIYTDKEIMMDDISPSNVDFKCIFEKFQVDEVSIDEAEDDICFNAQVMFEGASCVGLNRLKYTEDESTVEKRIVSIHEPPLEMGFIDKLIEMFKIRKFSARSQARDGTIRRIIQWVCP